ncbi:ion channel [Aeromonas caviae]|uniref:ion channel n=2 Tax=Aeromonadaceae TaxID=84642 RepID=UPI002B4616E9|nr:ion channel [Aeromonas caviae]
MLTIFLVGIPVILVNMLLQSLVSVWCIRFYVKRFNRREGALAGMLALFGIITLVMLGNLAQIGVWGGLFLWLGEFDTLQEAVYHSGVNFATLGYGDIVMSPQWKLLGPLEAVNGALMIGLSGASMLAVLQHHIRNQLADSPPLRARGPPAATPFAYRVINRAMSAWGIYSAITVCQVLKPPERFLTRKPCWLSRRQAT